MDQCLFCKISSGEIPSYKVYEDDFCFAFLDINPISKGHTIVIPKKHFDNFIECNEKYLSKIISTVKRVALTIKIRLNADGINILSNLGEEAGQTINHFHFHIIPRYKKDNIELIHNNSKNKYDLEQICNKLK